MNTATSKGRGSAPLTEAEVVELVDTICRYGDGPANTAALLSLIHEIDQSHRIKPTVGSERLECDEITGIVLRRVFGLTQAAQEAESAFVTELRAGAHVQIR